MTTPLSSCSDNAKTAADGDQRTITDEQLARLDCYTALHLHLDGSLSLPTVRQLARLQDIPLDLSDEELWERLQVDEGCQDLNQYLQKFDFPLTLLQTPRELPKASSCWPRS